MSAVRKLTADVITYKKSVMFLYALQKRRKKTCYAAATYVYIIYIKYMYIYFYLFSNMFRDRKQKLAHRFLHGNIPNDGIWYIIVFLFLYIYHPSLRGNRFLLPSPCFKNKFFYIIFLFTFIPSA